MCLITALHEKKLRECFMIKKKKKLLLLLNAMKPLKVHWRYIIRHIP